MAKPKEEIPMERIRVHAGGRRYLFGVYVPNWGFLDDAGHTHAVDQTSDGGWRLDYGRGR